MKGLREQYVHSFNELLWSKVVVVILIKNTEESITDDTREVIVVDEC